MAEYIEREVTCEDCIHYAICIFHHHGDENKRCVHFKNKADVVEVRHGKWLSQKLLGENAWDCSECKTLGSPQWKWCPICGAKMDGVTDTNVGDKMNGKGEGE